MRGRIWHGAAFAREFYTLISELCKGYSFLRLLGAGEASIWLRIHPAPPNSVSFARCSSVILTSTLSLWR